MTKYKNSSIKEYLDVLSKKEPVPGGGSAAALVGATGVSLLLMVAQYSKGRSSSKQVNAKIEKMIKEAKAIKVRLLELIDLDAKAYLKVVKTRKSSAKVKAAALKQARQVPLEICKLCYKAVDTAPYLVKHGNPNLLSDVQAAVEMLLAGFNSAVVFVSQQ